MKKLNYCFYVCSIGKKVENQDHLESKEGVVAHGIARLSV